MNYERNKKGSRFFETQCIVVCVEFLSDVTRQKLLKSANVARSYSKNNSGTFFVHHNVSTGESTNSVYFDLWWICRTTCCTTSCKINSDIKVQLSLGKTRYSLCVFCCTTDFKGHSRLKIFISSARVYATFY